MQSLRVLARAAPLARSATPRAGVRGLATEAPKPPARESSFVERWIMKPEAWPIFAVVGGACTLATYKLWHDANAPDTHWGKKERGTIDYVENNRSPPTSWSNSIFHDGLGVSSKEKTFEEIRRRDAAKKEKE